ncbi:MAG: hypothetical protein WCL44_09170 [bacterium]
MLFCVADHFEPFRRVPGEDGLLRDSTPGEARELVRAWTTGYPAQINGFRDWDGVKPRHSFFYPEEEYDSTCMDMLAKLSASGCGEVEVHLHHRNDTPSGFHEKLVRFRDLLRKEHGLLGTWRSKVEHGDGGGLGPRGADAGGDAAARGQGSIAYGFVHGNWSLCNSRPDGDWCGVNEELGILGATGCYADFTFPSAPSPTQPRIVNSIYRAVDTPGRPRGCDRGERSSVMKGPCEDGGHGRSVGAGQPLLLIQGPLGLRWSDRKWGIVPRLENAEISAAGMPTADRVRLWERQGIHVAGRPEWVFVKLHTHGCVEGNRMVVLGEAMRTAWRFMQERYNDGRNWRLHYVTAREMYNIVRAAEDGRTGDPGVYRDYEITPPPACGR